MSSAIAKHFITPELNKGYKNMIYLILQKWVHENK